MRFNYVRGHYLFLINDLNAFLASVLLIIFINKRQFFLFAVNKHEGLVSGAKLQNKHLQTVCSSLRKQVHPLHFLRRERTI